MANSEGVSALIFKAARHFANRAPCLKQGAMSNPAHAASNPAVEHSLGLYLRYSWQASFKLSKPLVCVSSLLFAPDVMASKPCKMVH